MKFGAFQLLFSQPLFDLIYVQCAHVLKSHPSKRPVKLIQNSCIKSIPSHFQNPSQTGPSLSRRFSFLSSAGRTFSSRSPVIPLVSVTLEQAGVAFQKASGIFSAPPGLVIIQHGQWKAIVSRGSSALLQEFHLQGKAHAFYWRQKSFRWICRRTDGGIPSVFLPRFLNHS